MALKSITAEHFRGKPAATYHFNPKLNRILGQNGAGKSTIKEMITFVFCGTDSEGNRNPQHLISRDQDAAKVSVQTDKAEITRTLTRKGNGTLKLTRDGMSTTYTQTQLETMLGSTDLFLSAFLPGFFLGLSTERQHKVIAEIRPKIDRVALFVEISGFTLTAEELLRYSLSRRADLVAQQVAADRREADRAAAQAQGEISGIESLKPMPKPELLPEAASLPRLEALRREWESYQHRVGAFNTVRMRRDRVVTENEQRAVRRGELQKQLDSLKQLEKPPYENIDLEPLRAKLLPMPPRPSLAREIETDNCSNCGQTVGLKHRERVRAQNEKLLEEYKAEEARVLEHNQKVQAEIAAAQKAHDEQKQKYLAVQEENRKTAAQRQRLEVEVASLVDAELPEAVEEPKAPEEPYDASAFDRAKKASDAYTAALAQYEFVNQQIAQSQEKLTELKDRVKRCQEHAARLDQIEEALKRLPQEELKRQASMFDDLGPIKVLVDTEVKIFIDGIPFGLASTGQQMKAGAAISARINSLMGKPINMLFLDNADLVDDRLIMDQQLFLAEVQPGQAEVQIVAE